MRSWNIGPCLFFIAVAFSFELPTEGKANAPTWLIRAAAMENPPFDPEEKPSVVVLWDEGSYELKADGRLTRSVRYAIRVLDNAGRKRAKAVLPYYQKATKIRSFKAWTIDENGKAHSYKKNEYQDRTQSTRLIYVDSRIRTLDGSARSFTGSVFGYEYEIESAAVFAQHRWWFQSDVPVAKSKLSFTLPKGWSLRETPLHGAPSARVDDRTYAWEMSNCSILKSEPGAPSSAVERCSVYVDVIPPEGTKPSYSSLSIQNWEDLAAYKARIQNSRSLPNDKMITKAKELTQNSKSLWEKIQAIGEFAKDVEYTSVNYDMSSGGGYVPREASETFELGYGDCKDKTALLRALLKGVGVESYAVTVNAIDRDRVDLNWPSPGYFNHCIAAVVVDESVESPAVLENSKVGRLLFIDPTSPITPVGELPFAEQGGYSVLSSEKLGTPVRLPQSSPEHNLEEFEIEAEIFENGGIVARVKQRLLGKPANDERVKKRYRNDVKYLAGHERSVSKQNKGAVVKLADYKDNALADRSVELTLEIGIPKYGQSMRGQLLVFKPALLSRMKDSPYDKRKKERTMPISFRASAEKMRSSIYIPIGYEVEDAKDDVEIETAFGRYQSSVSGKEGQIIYERSLVIHDIVVPASDYAEVQQFYAAVIEADQAPVVLARVAQ